MNETIDDEVRTNVALLKRGSNYWNENRPEQAKLRGAELTKARLKGADLGGANLEGAKLSEARLKGANLKGAKLSEARLKGANLEGANLYGANLKGAKLEGANLKGANLEWTKLEGARLEGADLDEANLDFVSLEGANLSEANLEQASLYGANLKRASLYGTDLKGANLEGANLEGANLKGANLDGTDLTRAKLKEAAVYRVDFSKSLIRQASFDGVNLRNAKAFRLNETFIRGSQFRPAGFWPRTGDPWTQLRQRYTGSQLFFNLILLVGFMIPLIAKVLFWSAVHESQAVVDQRAPIVREAISEARASLPVTTPPKISRALDRADEILANPKCLGAAECNERSIASVLFGFGHGPWWIPPLAILLLFYNALRGGLTWAVGQMRDDEERSGWSPPDDRKFKTLEVLHYVVWGLGTVSLIAFLASAVSFLTSTVAVPW